MEKRLGLDWTKLLTSESSKNQFLRFVVVGSFGTAASYLCYLIPLLLGMSPVWSYNFSFACGLVIAYILHLKITFRKNHSNLKLLAFIAVSFTNYLVGLAILNWLISVGVEPWLAGLLFLFVTVPLGFVLNRYVVVST